MPCYLYRCESCNEHFEARHSITIKHTKCSQVADCEEEGDLIRMPSFSRYIKPSVDIRDEPLGKPTRDAIEEMRQELKEQKEKLSQQEYND